MPKIRNIIIFIVIVIALILGYIFFIKPSSSDQANLVSTTASGVSTSTTGTINANATSAVSGDFLALLLNVKTIKLDDAIFSDSAFSSLHDSSITLTPDGTEGRPNPFAQFGNDSVSVATPTSSTTTPTTPTVPTTPATITPTTPKTTTPKTTTPAKKTTTSTAPTTPTTPVPTVPSSSTSQTPTAN